MTVGHRLVAIFGGDVAGHIAVAPFSLPATNLFERPKSTYRIETPI